MEFPTFRIFSCSNDDYGKTRVRIDKEQMKNLGIESGDVVKILGNRTTAATCLPLESTAEPKNLEFIFLNDPKKNVPLISISSSVSANMRGANLGKLVQVGKIRAVEASKVILASNKTVIPYEENDLLLDRLEGLVIGKGDGVSVPHGVANAWDALPFLVIDATPTGDYWIISKKTRIEFVEISEEGLYQMHTSKLDRLVRVIPVVKQIISKYFDLTFPSLEVYSNATRFYFYMQDRVSNPREGIQATAYPTIKAWDDLGNSYVVIDWQGHGGRQIGFNDFENEISGILVPSLDKKASELNFAILEMVWQINVMHPPSVAPNESSKETKFSYMRSGEISIEIASGPWEFKIPLK